MKHLTISEYGSFVGIEAGRLVVRENEKKIYFPLNRLTTISVAKRGISFSSDLIEALSARGIKLFFLDFRGVAHAALLGESQHGVVAVRQAQQRFFLSKNLNLAIQIVRGKIKNQRAVLNYFGKYHHCSALSIASEELLLYASKAGESQDITTLLGFEGISAASYFQALREARLFSSTFVRREGRGVLTEMK